MKISERPEFAAKPKPLTFTPENSVAEAVARMSEFNFGSVMIVDEQDRLLGVVTERDVLKRLPTHPAARINELMPTAWTQLQADLAA